MEVNQSLQLTGIQLPEGWTPQTIRAQINLSADHPETPPRIILPANIRHNGSLPSTMLENDRWQRDDKNAEWQWTAPDWGDGWGSIRGATRLAILELTQSGDIYEQCYEWRIRRRNQA
ncbi:hypothetical protein [Halorarum salinum]|uniref:Uncharacterized protein n=1 Tax=Halorarum salinum TaxID=2743089 RepID=A0A7D5LAD4_9EURY|nr:hypothetical protein [Halobaculum salinum]QLG61972.1 hypothetical protein HUG12_09665 [Halobaculum salinum]